MRPLKEAVRVLPAQFHWCSYDEYPMPAFPTHAHSSSGQVSLLPAGAHVNLADREARMECAALSCSMMLGSDRFKAEVALEFGGAEYVG